MPQYKLWLFPVQPEVLYQIEVLLSVVLLQPLLQCHGRLLTSYSNSVAVCIIWLFCAPALLLLSSQSRLWESHQESHRIGGTLSKIMVSGIAESERLMRGPFSSLLYCKLDRLKDGNGSRWLVAHR